MRTNHHVAAFFHSSFIDFSTSSSTSRLYIVYWFFTELPIRAELDVVPASSSTRQGQHARLCSDDGGSVRPGVGDSEMRRSDDLWSNNCRDDATRSCRRRRNIWWTHHWSLATADRLRARVIPAQNYIIVQRNTGLRVGGHCWFLSLCVDWILQMMHSACIINVSLFFRWSTWVSIVILRFHISLFQ